MAFAHQKVEAATARNGRRPPQVPHRNDRRRRWGRVDLDEGGRGGWGCSSDRSQGQDQCGGGCGECGGRGKSVGCGGCGRTCTVHLLFGPILHVSLSYAHIIDIGLDQADVGLHSLLVEREVRRARGAKRDEERRATRGGERSGVSVWLCTLVKCGQARKPGERSGGGGEGWSVNLSQTT